MKTNILFENRNRKVFEILGHLSYTLYMLLIWPNITCHMTLINFRFTGSVKLKGIIVIGGEEDTHPDKMRL